MAIITMPYGDKAFMVRSQSWGLRHNVAASVSPLSGSTQTVAMPGARWVTELFFPDQLRDERLKLEALFNSLQGGVNRLELWDQTMEAPRGTCNTSGVMVTAGTQFLASVTLTGLGASRTVLQGDKFRVPLTGGLSQLVQAASNVTANGSGVATVPITSILRAGIASGGSVIMVRPTALFIPVDGGEIPFPRGPLLRADAVSVKLVEVFS